MCFTYVKDIVRTALGDIETIENDNYRIYLFTDLLLYTRVKEKGKQKYVNRIYLDRLRLTDIVNSDSITNFFFQLFANFQF